MQRYVYIGQFEVRPEQQAEFVRHYGPRGTGAELFRRAPGELEKLLWQDAGEPTRSPRPSAAWVGMGRSCPPRWRPTLRRPDRP
jgi:hypothetical protein